MAIEWKMESIEGKQESGIVASGITEDSNERHYKFFISRIKDEETKEEHLRMRAFCDNEENGTVEIDNDKIDTGLLSLRRYGIFFSDDNTRLKLKHMIESRYLDIPINIQKNEISKRIKECLEAVGEYIIASSKEENKNGLYYMPVGDFDVIALDCGYADYDMKGIRKYLKENDLIQTTGARYTKVVRIHNKPTRVMAFKIKELQEKIGEKAY